jgi:hypothetical protein
MTNESQGRGGVTLETVSQMMKLVAAIPTPWCILILAMAFVSTLEVTLAPSGWTATFNVSSVTVAVLGLLWLPVLIKVLALAGGSMKTPAGEATSGGLIEVIRALTPEAKREALPSVIAALSSGPDAERSDVKAIRGDLEMQLSIIPADPDHARVRLRDLASQYEKLRGASPSSPFRTFNMTRLVAEAMGFVREARHEPAQPVEFSKESDGERIIDLASIQTLPRPDGLAQVLDAIQASKSAFEQYQALTALEKLVPLLSSEQRHEAAEVLEVMRSSGGVRQITRDDPSRWILSGRLLARLSQDH